MPGPIGDYIIGNGFQVFGDGSTGISIFFLNYLQRHYAEKECDRINPNVAIFKRHCIPLDMASGHVHVCATIHD